jgi:plasmid replication initiation protein
MKEATQRDISRHIDEGNLARLGLISIQERIPEDLVEWKVEFNLGGTQAQLQCAAVLTYGGVPHGLDNDVSLALLTIYQAAGSSADGTFVTTAYQILKSIGLDTSGRYYRALRESLMRLTHTTYTASQAWHADGRWQSRTFRYIDDIEFTHKHTNELDSSSVIRITLGKEIVRSVRARYIKPLDFELFTSLKRPLTRALFRLLDGQRLSPDLSSPVKTFRIRLLDWADMCKVIDKRPEKIRRTLKNAHDELIEREYLEQVEYIGTGKVQVIVYHFGRIQPLPEPAAVDLLVRNGLSLPMAQLYAREFGYLRIKERLALFNAIIEAGYRPRNRQGFLVDVLRDQTGKYANPGGFTGKHRQVSQPVQTEDEVGALHEAESAVLASWKARTAQERISHLKTLLGILLRKQSGRWSLNCSSPGSRGAGSTPTGFTPRSWLTPCPAGYASWRTG